MEQTGYKQEYQRKYRKLGIFFIVLGSIFAIETMTSLGFLYKLWPLILTVIGCGFIGIFCKRDRREGLFLALGSFFVFFSFLALYLNFNSWEQLSRLWPLFITFPGLCFIIVYVFGVCNRLYLFAGLTLLSISLVFFIVFSFSHNYWWSIFIFLGISCLLAGESGKRKVC